MLYFRSLSSLFGSSYDLIYWTCPARVGIAWEFHGFGCIINPSMCIDDTIVSKNIYDCVFYEQSGILNTQVIEYNFALILAHIS